MSSTVRLDDASVEAVARRVAELLLGKEVVSEELVAASEIARRFGISTDYVYRHADDLGVLRLGDGPKARLRFDPKVVMERLNASGGPGKETLQRSNPSAVRRTPRVNLLPVRGKSP